MKLLIVESPNKCKKLQGFLNEIEPNTWRVIATVGHWRQLPPMDGQSFSDVVDIRTWAETFVVQNSDVERRLRTAIRQANTVYLATDPDREGEAIAWHLVDHFKLVGAHRVEYQEITKDAVAKAIRGPRPLNTSLVEAQRARAILDYLLGMEISRRLWRFGAKSAGRVQSCVLRLLVDREQAIKDFVKQSFWTLEASYCEGFTAVVFDHKPTADTAEQLAVEPRRYETEPAANNAAEQGRGGRHVVSAVDAKEVLRKPPPPFTTANLLAAASKIGLSTSAATAVAQSLYEAGHITYIRTDSVALAPEAVDDIRAFLSAHHPEVLPEQPQTHRDKAGAQAGHEAIRPTSISTPLQLEGNEAKLYELIWTRAVCSQAASARYARTITTIEVEGRDMLLRAAVSVRVFDGFERIAKDALSDASGVPELSQLKQGQVLTLDSLAVKQGATKPPPRYTAESLLKYLERHAIGRPATYNNLFETLFERGYCATEGKHLVPQELGFVSDALVRLAFDAISQQKFTAVTERSLDKIASRSLSRPQFLSIFYTGFTAMLEQSTAILQRYAEEHPEYDRDARIEHDAPCPSCGGTMVRRSGKYGPYARCEAENCGKILNLTPLKVLKRAKCPDCSGAVVEQPYMKDGKRKKFYRCQADCGWKSSHKPGAKRALRAGAPSKKLQTGESPSA